MKVIILIGVVLVILLVLVCWKRHRWVALAHILIWTGVSLGVLAAAFALGPDIGERYGKFDATSNIFASIGRDLAAAISNDLAKRLIIIAGGYFFIGLILRIIWGRRHRKQIPKMLRQN